MKSTRRNFVRGAALAGLSGFVAPLVRSALQTVSAQEPADTLRFLFVTTTNGWWPGQNTSLIGDMDMDNVDRFADWRELGRTIPREHVDANLRDRVLPPIFAPLERYKSRMLFVDGLSQQHRDHEDRNNHSKGAQLFNGLGDEGEGLGAAAETVDQYLARHLRAPRPWVGMGVTRNDRNQRVTLNSIGADGNRVPFIVQTNLAFETYFGGLGAADEPAEARPFMPSLFDGSGEQIRQARSLLRGSERDVLDSYLTHVEQMATTFEGERAVGASCDPGAAMAEPANHGARRARMFDMAATALGCGLTRVAWLCFGGGASNTDFNMNPAQMRDIAGADAFLHQVAHVHDVSGYNAKQAFQDYHAWHSEQLAACMDRLAAMPNGRGGSALDDTVIVYMNDNGTLHHNSVSARHPICLFGDAGGRLKADGRYVRFPFHPDWWNPRNNPEGGPGAASVQQLWNTLAHLAGAPRDDFGIGPTSLEPHRGPLTELFVDG